MTMVRIDVAAAVRPVAHTCLAIFLAVCATVGAPAAFAQTGAGREVLIQLSGSGTIGSKMALNLANSFARINKFPSTRIDAGQDPDEFDVVAETSEGAQKLRIRVQAKGTVVGL